MSMACSTHEVPAGTECPDGGACMDRYGISPEQWAGWFERDSGPAGSQPGTAGPGR
jgi:hypothetical protein